MDSTKEKLLEALKSVDFYSIKDHPNILIAAGFWEKERYGAAKVCYKFMRTIDDLIDDYKTAHKIFSPADRIVFIENVNHWLRMTINSEDASPVQKELTETIQKFMIPVWPLEAFARSMIYDINNNGFSTLDDFLSYSQGASVAPASIFVHLNGLTKKDGIYCEPAFDVREAATPCAIFSYIVHIIRDFQKDQLNNLNYFAEDLILKHGLSHYNLRQFANGRVINSGFRSLIEEYCRLADEYRKKTIETIGKIKPLLEPRYQLSLEIIFDLYTMVYERIDIRNGKFTTEELNPTPEETKKRVFATIMSFTPEVI